MMTTTIHGPESDLQSRLETLLREHPPKSLDVRGVDWHYISLGTGETGLLLLPGAAGGGEAYFRLAPKLADRYRLVMVSYPVVGGLDEMLEGLAAILDAEGIDRTALMGGSFGGTVAQAFLLRYPERTTRVILTGTVPASPARAISNRRWLRVLRLIPMPWMRSLLRLVLRKTMKNITRDRDFWERFYIDAVNSLTWEDLATRYRIGIDFDRDYAEKLGNLENWPGEILILEGSEDAMAKPESRKALKSAYPMASIHTFEGAGHGMSLERPEEYEAVVFAFLGNKLSRPLSDTG
jgi:pimeloyl-ACP methyl ester carboxylesterase